MATSPRNSAQWGEVLRLLKAHGVPYKQDPGWLGNSGSALRAFAPVGMLEHWTASPSTANSYLRHAGERGLRFLCNVALERDGTLVFMAGQYANHAGGAVRSEVNRLVSGRMPLSGNNMPRDRDSLLYSPNRSLIGLEGKAGPGAPYTQAQHDSATALWAACTIAWGWNRQRPPLGAHKEITTRKPGDPSHNMGQRRRDVVALIAKWTGTDKPAVPPPTPAKPSAPTPASGQRRLVVDGKLGPHTYRGLQAWAGMPLAKRTGVLDAESRKAVQRKLGVTPDGVIGPRTVRALQQMLNRYGSRLTVDGRWGEATTRALQAYLNGYFPRGV